MKSPSLRSPKHNSNTSPDPSILFTRDPWSVFIARTGQIDPVTDSEFTLKWQVFRNGHNSCTKQ